jgi:hypothetical protein
MDVKKVALVIFDIGGYTEFIKFNKDSLAHAHEVISQLLESIADGASHPLVLNKFEGDAALLYAVIDGDESAAALDISRQVFGLFPLFKEKALELSNNRSACPCDACQNIRNLRLKAVVHKGEAAFRKIRQFEEIAGEDVIIVHRLLKNNVEIGQYVLMTEPFFSRLDASVQSQGKPLVEQYDHIGTVTLKVFDPATVLHPAPAAQKAGGLRGLAQRLGFLGR